MSWQLFTIKWFAIYYVLLGMACISVGLLLLIKAAHAVTYLLAHSSADQPPPMVRMVLKYFFLFTLPCLIFSFIPFSWIELLFSAWSLCIIYLLGLQMVRWPQTRGVIENHPQQAQTFFRYTGAGMMAVSIIIFFLAYISIQQLVTL